MLQATAIFVVGTAVIKAKIAVVFMWYWMRDISEGFQQDVCDLASVSRYDDHVFNYEFVPLVTTLVLST